MSNFLMSADFIYGNTVIKTIGTIKLKDARFSTSRASGDSGKSVTPFSTRIGTLFLIVQCLISEIKNINN